MNNEPKIGLVTVLYNGIEVLEGFFESLAKQTYKNYVLYVIDNSPNELALNEAKRLSVHYNIPSEFVYNNANLGVAKGNNQGIEKAREDECDFVLLINYDTEFNHNLVSELVAGFEQYDCEMIVPKIMYYDEPKMIWCAGGKFRCLHGFDSMHIGVHEQDNGQYNEPKYVNYSPTCCMMIKTTVFNIVGYMDEKYFVYADDADFCYRAFKCGIKLLYLPTATILHKVSTTTGGGYSTFSIYYSSRNIIYFCKKHAGLALFFYCLVYYQIRYVLKFLLKKFTFSQFKVAQKGFFDGIKFR